MSWHTVALHDVPPSPWKNGGGVTRELMAWPSPQDWVWRMSVAEVQSSGPFSIFDGVQRWFAVLAGAGVRLKVAGQANDLTQASQPFCFDGAAAVDCALLDGATQDFNLMLRQGQARGRMQRVRGAISCAVTATHLIAVYARSAGASVQFGTEIMALPADTLTCYQAATDTLVHITATDALLMEIAPCP